MILAEILHHKGAAVIYVEPAAKLAGVLAVLGQYRIGAAVVIDATGRMHGILSERDVVCSLWRHGASALGMTAEQTMTRDVAIATPRTTVAEAMRIMTERRFRHIPVLDAGGLAGLVSIGDVVKARVDEQLRENASLRAYIAGGV